MIMDCWCRGMSSEFRMAAFRNNRRLKQHRYILNVEQLIMRQQQQQSEFDATIVKITMTTIFNLKIKGCWVED